jgi:hypothetical protein
MKLTKLWVETALSTKSITTLPNGTWKHKEEMIMVKDNFVKWIKAAAIRALRTVAQSALATIGTSAVLGDVNWIMVGSAAALAGILSILTSVATGLPEVKE